MNAIERRVNTLAEQFDIRSEPWCPECGYGEKAVILVGDAPVPVCTTCGKGPRGDGIRIIRISDRKDGPR